MNQFASLLLKITLKIFISPSPRTLVVPPTRVYYHKNYCKSERHTFIRKMRTLISVWLGRGTFIKYPAAADVVGELMWVVT